MTQFLIVLASLASLVLLLYLLNQLSYGVLKRRVLRSRAWDLNICCGHTDGGGVNVDIIQHSPVPNYTQVEDVCVLPFSEKQFAHTLCSHTIEHVEDPAAFDRELRRVSRSVTYLVPPLWDLGAAFNVFEHRWIFLTWRTRHVDRLPPYVRLPFSRSVQTALGQTIAA